MFSNPKRQLDLLETISIRSDCMYLSDLRFGVNRKKLRMAVKSIDPTLYDIDEWREAVRYIVGYLPPLQSSEDAARFLHRRDSVSSDLDEALTLLL